MWQRSARKKTKIEANSAPLHGVPLEWKTRMKEDNGAVILERVDVLAYSFCWIRRYRKKKKKNQFEFDFEGIQTGMKDEA